MDSDVVTCYKTGELICNWNFTNMPRVGEKVYYYCYYEVVDIIHCNVDSQMDYYVNIKVKKCQ